MQSPVGYHCTLPRGFINQTGYSSVQRQRLCVRVGLGVGQIDKKLGKTALGGRIVSQDRRESRIAEWFWEALSQSLSRACVVAQSQEAPNNMLQKTNCLLFYQLIDHVAQNGTNGVEAFICLADVCQSDIVEEYLLHDKNGDGLGELGAGFHDSEAERDNLGGEEEVDDFTRVILDECADDAEGCKTKVFEGSRFGSGIEEGV
jgi:hypothetical protein